MIQAKPTARPRAPWKVWRDPAGQLSWLRIVTLVGLFVPFFIATYDYQVLGIVPARPINDVIHRVGFWALMFLLISLAITPLRRIGRFNQLLDVRRMIGVGAFVYIAVHLFLYIADQMFDLKKVASEIVLRLYLTIGFVALLGLGTLAATSTDGMVRRLGTKRWQKLHQAIYVITGLALIHYFQQTKADVSVPTFVAGLAGWLIGYRLLIWWRAKREEPPTWMLLALTVAVTLLTFICEAIGISIVFHAPVLSVLQGAFDFDFDMIEMNRPGWFVLAAGLIVVLIDLVRSRLAKPRRRVAPAKPAAETA